ncbi:MAG: leucine-rich repeat protein, partial [Bacilli bacterium]|nr:leucine-rich repeat protein [Bacilli bacterium]
MKKKNRLFVLSLTSLLGLTLMGCDMAKAIPNSEKEEPEVINDEVTYNDHFGTLVKLGAAPSSDPKNVAIATSFGYQIAEESADKMSVRIIAAVDDYKGISSAKITSKVVGYREEKNTPSENEEVVKEETEFAVTAVYSSLSADLDIKWTSTLNAASFASPYFMVYTLNDIPSEHWFDTISVTFSATAANNASESFVFNAMGLHGDYARNISYTLDEGLGGYVTYKNSTASSISKIYLPEKHVEINSFYAKPLGDIVALNTTGNTGTFESVTGITEIHLPKTIKKIGGWAFSTSSLKKVNIPENVVSTGSTILSSSAHLEELSYEAKNLVNDSNSYSATIDVVRVSKKVESLPNKFFSSSYLPKKVIYEGTEAEWAALKNEGNAENGFFIDEVYCSDTTTSTITYHYGEGKIGETTGDVALTVINGHTLPNPGNPIANEPGQEFKGWFLDEALTIPADFTSSVSANADLYAKYGDFGPGISMANPRVLTPTSASSFSANLVPGKKAEFIKFEMPANAAADWFYLTIESNGCVVDRSVSTATYTRLGIEAYDAQGNKLDIGSQGITNDKKVQKVNNDDYRIRFYAEAGEAIYFKAMLHSGNEDVYGTIAFSFNTYANDSIGEAIPMAFGESKAVSFVSKYQRVLYSYTATETKTVALRKDQIGGAYGGFTVVDAAEPTLSLGSFSKSYAGLVLLNQVAGHTYLIEANATDASTAESYITLSIEDAPQGALAVDPIAYTLGDEVTVASIAPQYVYSGCRHPC